MPSAPSCSKALSISASAASTSFIGRPATKPTKVSGRARTSSAISSLARRARSAVSAGSPSASSGGAARLMICAYSSNGSITRSRSSISHSERIEAVRLTRLAARSLELCWSRSKYRFGST
jgi:hypothetical protein